MNNETVFAEVKEELEDRGESIFISHPFLSRGVTIQLSSGVSPELKDVFFEKKTPITYIQPATGTYEDWAPLYK